MKPKGLYLLLAVLVALIVITWIYKEGRKPSEPTRLLSDLGDIEKIVLNRGDSTIVLELAGDEWMIASPIESATDREAVSELIDGLNRIELGEVVTRRSEMYETFGVDEGKKTKISLHSSSGEISFIAGKTAGFNEGYLRSCGEDAVYLAKGFPRHGFSKGLDHWREKSILSISENAVEGIDFIYPSRKFSLLKEDGVWKVNGDHADSSKILVVLATLENFRADGFAYKREFDPEVTLEVKLVDGSHERILIGELEDRRYPVIREGDETIFLVNTWKVDRLKKKPSDFR